jgi:geranylgeranyl diphosphate synthase type II
MSAAEELARAAAGISEALDCLLPRPTGPGGHVAEAMRHSIQGGKRIRPFVCLKAGETFGAEPQAFMLAACGLEMIHTATLIHDDLPSIDDSHLRRGRPTCHVAFDEPTAILAGDALLIEGFRAIARQVETAPADRVAQVVAEVARFAGAEGVVAGEAADIRAEGQKPDVQALAYIHEHKTAALFEACVRAGAILAGADRAGLNAITEYGRSFGLVFQITDDLLDVVGQHQALGKPAGADAARGKLTYPSLYGVARSRERAAELARAGRQQAGRLPALSAFWCELLDLLLSRTA